MRTRLLVVDDDAQVRRALAASLARAGFDVDTADEGASAMAMATTAGAPYDLVLVDYQMKTASGPEVVRHFKERFGDLVYCAVLSGDDGSVTRAACFDAGADDVFVKPASPSELRRRLTEAARTLRAGMG